MKWLVKQNLAQCKESSIKKLTEASLIENSLTLPSTSTNPYTLPDYTQADFSKKESCLKIDFVGTSVEHSVEHNKRIQNQEYLNKLKIWFVENRICHSSMTSLLKLQKTYLGIDVPEDSRTLFKIKKVNHIKKMGNGEYYHFNLKDMVIKVMELFNLSNELVHLEINFDGLPLTKSSKSQFWPILGYIEETRSNFVFPIGIFHGQSKPPSCEIFLQKFIEECREIISNGIVFKEKTICIVISKILCDAPAKSFILNVKGHNAYFGCTKCKTEGDFYNNRMIYPEISAPLRTDTEFMRYLDDDYHKGISPLLQLNIGLVSQVPLDYMHLVCLGVMKKLLMFWIKGDLEHRFSEEALSKINQDIEDYKKCAIIEFARKPRPLTDIEYWKATEFRQFLLYYGPYLIEPYLQKQLYINFLALHVAIRILSSPNLCYEHNDYAKKLLKYFIENFSEFYGKKYISHNIHNLIHLSADVLKFGPLDNFSCFKFENYMSEIKKAFVLQKNHCHNLSTEQLKNCF